MFMTEQGLEQFQATNGWKVGIDGSLTVIAIRVGGEIDTNSISSLVVGLIFDQKGLMYNLTFEGSKISRIERWLSPGLCSPVPDRTRPTRAGRSSQDGGSESTTACTSLCECNRLARRPRAINSA